MKRAFIDLTPDTLSKLLRLRERIEISDAELIRGHNLLRIYLEGDGLPEETHRQEGEMAYAISACDVIERQKWNYPNLDNPG